MKLSKKKSKALYDAIYNPILNARLKVISPRNGNMMYTPLAVDEKLHQLEVAIWKEVCKVLEIEVDSIITEKKSNG